MNGNKICSIICGAPDGTLDRSAVEGLVICADSGLDHALAAGIQPDIVVGDFDSAKSEVPDSAEVIRVSPIKDDTDTILAAETAIQRGCTELRLFCAVGGRFDHTFANVQTLEYLHEKGVTAVLYGAHESIVMLWGGESRRLKKHNGYVSLFALTETAVVSEEGMKYPLDRYTLKRSFPLGVSNEIADDIGTITVHSGIVILCEYI
ncbi:MAG: thiamine diphosphokinase [Oscillospiraceae bacterium]